MSELLAEVTIYLFWKRRQLEGTPDVADGGRIPPPHTHFQWKLSTTASGRYWVSDSLGQ